MDLMASSGSAGEGDSAKKAERIRYYKADPELVSLALKVRDQFKKSKVVKGTIASGNFWNNELDRIEWLHKEFGSSVEEMETSSAAQISHSYSVPFIGVRVLSNNLTNNGHYNPKTAHDCQNFVLLMLEAYISNIDEI